jgi:hypothetical protein
MKKIFSLLFAVIAFAAAHAQADSTLKEYAGKYNFPDGSVVTDVTVTYDNGALSMVSSAGTSSLEKTSDIDVFTITQFQGTASFKRNDDKKVHKVVVDAMGYHLEGSKETVAIVLLIQRAALLKNKLQQLTVR